MRNALIGAFVLSVMLVPAAALAVHVAPHTFDLQINSTGTCAVLDEDGNRFPAAAGIFIAANTTVQVKTNGNTVGTCRLDLDTFPSPLLDPVEFSITDGIYDCFIDTTKAAEWEESINRQGKLILN